MTLKIIIKLLVKKLLGFLDDVEILSATIRMNQNNQVTDIYFIDRIEIGNVCAVDILNGSFGDVLINQFGSKMKTLQVIPNSGIIVPKWNEIIQLIKNGHT